MTTDEDRRIVVDLSVEAERVRLAGEDVSRLAHKRDVLEAEKAAIAIAAAEINAELQQIPDVAAYRARLQATREALELERRGGAA